MTKDSSKSKADRKKLFFIQRLLKWSNSNLKNLPWRKEKDPYRILIAEVMLQRTRAEQVLPIYKEFISKFPDFNSLIQANQPQIMKFMNRLGLYWRSDLILKMANKIVNDFDGKVPKEREKLITVPGIGNYIADMIAVLAFHGRRTVIDSNVVRLVTRFFGIKSKGEMRREKNFINFCQDLIGGMSSNQIRNFNLALIDFPSIICKPIPLCHICPLSSRCMYFSNVVDRDM